MENSEGTSHLEKLCSKEYGQLAQHYAERFVDMLSVHEFSPEQIKLVMDQVQSSFGMDAEHLSQLPNIGRPKDEAALSHAADWVAEVNSRAQHHLYNKVGRTPVLVPSTRLTEFRPSNRAK